MKNKYVSIYSELLEFFSTNLFLHFLLLTHAWPGHPTSAKLIYLEALSTLHFYKTSHSENIGKFLSTFWTDIGVLDLVMNSRVVLSFGVSYLQPFCEQWWIRIHG